MSCCFLCWWDLHLSGFRTCQISKHLLSEQISISNRVIVNPLQTSPIVYCFFFQLVWSILLFHVSVRTFLIQISARSISLSDKFTANEFHISPCRQIFWGQKHKTDSFDWSLRLLLSRYFKKILHWYRLISVELKVYVVLSSKGSNEAPLILFILVL